MSKRAVKKRLLSKWKAKFPDASWSSITDEEIIRIIGSEISTFVKGSVRGKGIIWAEKYPTEAEYLRLVGTSEADALKIAEAYLADQRSRFPVKRETGRVAQLGDERIVASPGESRPVLYVETEYTHLGFKSRPMPILLSDYEPIEGTRSSVCPNADLQIPVPLVERIATELRNRKFIAKNQSIHWLGRTRGLQYICTCQWPSQEDAAGVCSERTPVWSEWHQPKQWCRMLGIGDGHFSHWCKRYGLLEERDLRRRSRGREVQILIQKLVEMGHDYSAQ